MRSATILSAAALAGLAAASPAPQPQQLDFGLIEAAPTVPVGPTGVELEQIAPLETDVVVTTTAVAAATGAVSKREANPNVNLLADVLNAYECLWLNKCKAVTSSAATTTKKTTTATPLYVYSTTAPVIPTTTTPAATTTLAGYKSSSTTAAASTTTSAASSTSSSAASSSSTGSPTTQISTGTTTTSSSTACATQIEDGTYCGFINPEDPCAPQPGGSGPVASPDTVEAFYAYPEFTNDALSAPSQVPSSSDSGSSYSQVFQNLNGSIQANSYIGLYTLESYDTAKCASLCDQTDLCTAFNLYIERDPSQAPSANDSTAPTVWGYWCPNPASITNYKCTLWGSSIDATEATNYGDYREQFHVVITASNGYDRTNGSVPVCDVPGDSASSSAVPSTSTASSTTTTTAAATSAVTTTKASTLVTTTAKTTASTAAASTSPVSSPPSWSSGHNCGSKGYNAPKYSMGGKFFPGPFNSQTCADYALAQNAANKAAAVAKGLHSFTPCKQFNAQYLHKNGKPHGTYCNLYSTVLDDSYATFSVGYSGNDKFECKQSWAFSLQTDQSFGTC